MKKLILFFRIAVCSCSYNKNLHEEKNVEIFEKRIYDDYVLLYGKLGKDTMTFICSDRLIRDCNWLHKYIDRNGLTSISNIVTSKGDSLIFTYTAKDVNNNLKVMIGGGRPGQNNKKYIYSYSQNPYLVKDCESLK